ncbi:MAG: hypothetical protein KDK37_12670 [Leptospiraceae bacterium]|nr:hypothetical protein [Leptospiraceae bacterium]
MNLNIKERFKGMKSMLSPQNAMISMLKPFLPHFAGQLAEMEKPENGLLKEGEDKIAYILTHHAGDLIVSICPLTYDKAAGRMIVGQPINTQPIEKMLADGERIDSSEGEDADTGAH